MGVDHAKCPSHLIAVLVNILFILTLLMFGSKEEGDSGFGGDDDVGDDESSQ